jgi:hypothetical protein
MLAMTVSLPVTFALGFVPDAWLVCFVSGFRHQRPDGVEHNGKLAVVFPLQFIHAMGQIGMGRQQLPQADKRPVLRPAGRRLAFASQRSFS